MNKSGLISVISQREDQESILVDAARCTDTGVERVEQNYGCHARRRYGVTCIFNRNEPPKTPYRSNMIDRTQSSVSGPILPMFRVSDRKPMPPEIGTQL